MVGHRLYINTHCFDEKDMKVKVRMEFAPGREEEEIEASTEKLQQSLRVDSFSNVKQIVQSALNMKL